MVHQLKPHVAYEEAVAALDAVAGDAGRTEGVEISMTTLLPKRLIEVDLPINRISAHARREKSIRHGHISTLHIWWARRPLAACRAVICAALWPDPADPLCPQSFRDVASRTLVEFAKRITRTLRQAGTPAREESAAAGRVWPRKRRRSTQRTTPT